MRNNIVTAIAGDKPYIKTDSIFQYDYGQKLVIQGIVLPEEYDVHFSNTNKPSAKTVKGDSSGVIIPDEYLLNGEDVHAWVYLHTGEVDEDGETVYHIQIPVINRAAIAEEQITPVEHNVIKEALEQIAEAVEETQENVTHYPYINASGHWMVYDAQTEQFVDTGIDANGNDGYSPTVNVTDITGGHRVTITDASGPHTYDVMDGETPNIIDDAAGEGDTNKVWSADKSSALKNQINTAESETDEIKQILDIEDVVIPSKNLNVTPYGSSYTHHGVTFEANADNSVVVSGQGVSGGTYYPYPSTSSDFRFKLAPGTYCISGGSSSNRAVQIYLYESKSASSEAYVYTSADSGYSFTTDSEYWAVVVIKWTDTSAIAEPVTVYPQLEAGETATSYVSPFSSETKKESAVINEIKEDIEELQNTDVNVLTNLWKDKKVVFLGDSIVYGQNSEHPYSYYIAEATGITAYNYGIGSKKMLDWEDCYAKVVQYQTIPDAVIVGFGTNDFNADVSIGDFYTLSGTTRVPNTDGTTFKGAMRNLVTQIRTSFPSAVIIFVTPLHRGGTKSDLIATSGGKYLSDYVDAIKEGADVLSYEVIDLYSVLGVDPNFSSNEQWFDNAELHPNTVVHKRIAKVISSKMRSIGIGFSNTVYTVTNNLTDCTNSNASSTVYVDEGETVSYSATITPDSGYVLSSVECTMGGVAQTVTNGVISIASVTGNIVITAVAIESQYVPVTYSDLPDTTNKYVKADGALGSGSSYKAVYFECVQGETYVINSYSGQVAIVWGITSSVASAPYVISDYGTESAQGQHETTVTASSSGYMIVNHKTSGTLSIVKET